MPRATDTYDALTSGAVLWETDGRHGRPRFSPSGFHLCCWQDNGAGAMDVKGAAGQPDRDQPYTIERFAVLDAGFGS